MDVVTGQRITIGFEGREFDAIVIDPNGLGEDQPSVGFGFRMGEKYAGVPNDTLSRWVLELANEKVLELPSGKHFRVLDILASDGNTYSVVEASDWFSLAIDLLINPGRTGKGLRAKLGDFITWFAVKGFYAEAFVSLKGAYTSRDSRATTKWLEARQLGKSQRKIYTDLLQAEGSEQSAYPMWTDYIYQELFGMRAREMREVWDTVDGRPEIARNHIQKIEGLQAVAYCEDMVVRVFVDSLEEAHQTAVNLTKRKFLGES